MNTTLSEAIGSLGGRCNGGVLPFNIRSGHKKYVVFKNKLENCDVIQNQTYSFLVHLNIPFQLTPSASIKIYSPRNQNWGTSQYRVRSQQIRNTRHMITSSAFRACISPIIRKCFHAELSYKDIFLKHEYAFCAHR